MKNVSIAATGAYLPKRRVSNHEIAERLPDTSDEWISENTGIKFRHIAADNEAVAELGYEAAKIALDRAGVDVKDIGQVILATCTSDYAGLPASACVVQDRLGATNAAAFDVSACCSGFCYGLQVARGLLQFDQRPIVLMGSEVMSRVIDWDDYKTCVLFGDGAGAVVLTTDGPSRGIIDSIMGADGSGVESLYCDGGLRKPLSAWDASAGPPYLRMNGKKVFNFAVKAMVSVIKDLLERNQLSPDKIKYVVPHQPNRRIIRAAYQRVDIPEERFYLNLDEVANTSAASIPLCLAEMDEKGLLQRGDLIITVGFGAGLTYGGNLIEW